MKTTTYLCLACCLLLTLFPAMGRAQDDIRGLAETLKNYHYGDSTAILDKISAEVAAARLSQDKRGETARALTAILSSGAAFDAKQFACRQLVFVANDEQVTALAALLSDSDLAHYALLVLARIHTPAAADALAAALPGSGGRTEIEILDTLADLGDARAIPAASERLRARDASLRDIASAVLAKLADPQSVKALRTAYSSETGPAHIALGHALLAAAARLQGRGEAKPALEIYDLLENVPASPFLGAAALRGVAAARGEQALPDLIKALAEEGTRRQEAAAMLLREMPGRAVAEHLAIAAPKLRGQAQLLAIEILGDRADAVATPEIISLCRSADPKVRRAALHAIGALGDATSVPLLLSAAAAGDADDRAAARESLVRLRGAAVDRALLSALDTASPGAQVQAIQALGQRGSLGVAPRLLKAARSANASVSAAALRVLRDQGAPAILPSLVDLMLAIAPGDRDSALDAVTQVARRSPNQQSAMVLLLERLAAAGTPADRVTLVSAVGQVGGPGALAALRKASADPSTEVRVAALSALAEWPTDAPMNDLLRSARVSPDARQRAIALRGYLRMAGANEQRSPVESLALFKQVASLATRPDEKRLILAGLSKIPSLGALDYAASFRSDKEVSAEADLAVTEIGKATIGAWPEKTRAALEPISKADGNPAARARAEATLAVSRKFGDYIVAWEVSPAYQRDGADYTRLFDLPFPPEEPAENTVPWRPMPAGTTPEQPWLLDLLALWGGEQRVAYLRTAVRCETARDLVLEMGSDDGLKAWWNGEVVLAHNTARAVAPGQEKITVHAKPGWNRLLLKVTQNNQGWGAVARIINADGSPATELQFSVPSSAAEQAK